MKRLLFLLLYIPIIVNAQWKTKRIADPFSSDKKVAYIASQENPDVYLVLSRNIGVKVSRGIPNGYFYLIEIRIEGDDVSLRNPAYSEVNTQWIAKYSDKAEESGGGFWGNLFSSRETSRGIGVRGTNTVLYPLDDVLLDFSELKKILVVSSRHTSEDNPLRVLKEASIFIFRITNYDGQQTYTFNLSGSLKAINYVSSIEKSEILAEQKKIEEAKVKGCMDRHYMEYNPNAERESKADCKTLKINGCMDSRAENYNKNATVDSICNYLTTYEIKNKYYFYNDIESISLNNSCFVIGSESHSIKSNVHLENLNNRLKKLIKSCDFQSDIRINGGNSSQISKNELKDALLVLLLNNIQTPRYIIVRDNLGLFLGCLEMGVSSHSRDISFLNTYQSPEIIGYQITEITGTKSTDDIKELLDLIDSENDSCKIEIKNLYLDGDKLSFQLIQKSNSSNKLTKTQYLGTNMDGERIEYKNDKIVRKQEFKNNIAEGYDLVYYDSGEVLDSLFYVNGLQSGIQKRYYENGNLKGLMNINSHTGLVAEHSVAKKYHENGKLWVESRYNSNGKEHGQKTIYYDNGQLYKNMSLNNGIIEGEFKQYYKNGVVSIQSIYKSGKKNGYCKMYYENGELLSDANFVDNRIYKGRCNWYFSNGQVRYKLKFNKEGIGKGKEFSRDGKSSKPIEMRQEIKDNKYIWRLLKMY